MFDKGIDFLFNDVSLYSKESFSVFKLVDNQYEYDENELFRFLYYIGIAQKKLITYCHKCKKEFPFELEMELFELMNTNTKSYMRLTKLNNMPGYIDLEDGKISGMQPPYKKEMLNNGKIWYIGYYFTCTNDENHKYMMMITVELKDGKFIVRKIGQNPSMLSVKGFDFDQYKTFLDKINAYEDYKKAELCNSEHFYVGAYAYLRRIFEKMIQFYLGDTKVKDNHMDTKIDAVKDKFDPRIKSLLTNLYGILSISIHELDEEQSKEYYEDLKAVIDIQLEYIKTEADKDKQSKKLESTLSRIANSVKNNNK